MDKKRVFWPMLAVVVALAMVVSCAAPAAPPASPVIQTVVVKETVAPVVQTVVVKETVAPVVVTATPEPKPVAAAGPCGTDPVVLNAYFETGFDIPFKLAEEFTKQFPNVTWDTKQDQFTNLINSTPLLLAGDNAPDLLRLPTMVSFAQDGLLMNLDGYAAAFGWDTWPEPQRNP